MAWGLTRRRRKVHGQPSPSARPLSSSVLTVASPRYVLLDGFPTVNFTNGPVRFQLNTSPLTRPSTDPIDSPSGPRTSPFTFPPFCCSTHRIGRPIGPILKRNDPSHVPVTSTRVNVSVVQSPRAHPRLKSVRTVRSRRVHLMLVSQRTGTG